MECFPLWFSSHVRAQTVFAYLVLNYCVVQASVTHKRLRSEAKAVDEVDRIELQLWLGFRQKVFDALCKAAGTNLSDREAEMFFDYYLIPQFDVDRTRVCRMQFSAIWLYVGLHLFCFTVPLSCWISFLYFSFVCNIFLGTQMFCPLRVNL